MNQWKYLKEVYFKMGALLSDQSRHKTAIKVYKSILAIAWCTDDIAAELKVYNELGK